ncbi:MAG: HD domain-containing protein [Candidatus Saccharimonadales bacterium]
MKNNTNIEKAQNIATYAHDGQTRKGSDVPYIVHPIAVAELVQKQGASDEVVIAALLHDVLEDVSSDRYSRDNMLHDFGKTVVGLVEGVSEIKTNDLGDKIPWLDRKKAYIKGLQNGTDDMALVSLADKIHNISTFINDFSVQGDDMWSNFNSTPEQQHWYYRTLIETVFIPRFGREHQLVMQLNEFLDHFDQTFHLKNAVDKP